MTAIITPAAGGVGVKTWAGFVAMAVGMFMAILDIQIVASSLPEIQTGLGIALDQLSWVQTAYLMAEIVAIPLSGWLTRVMSTRGAFVACICGFTAGGALDPRASCTVHGPAIRAQQRDDRIRAAERNRLVGELEHRATTAEQRRDNVMAGHLRGAARILREAGDG